MEKDYLNFLIITPSQKSSDLLEKVIIDCFPFKNFGKIDFCFDSQTARRKVAEFSYNIVVINSPLTDEFGHQLASDISKISCAQVLILVKNEVFDDICRSLEPFGVITISKPLNRALFNQSIHLATSISLKLKLLEAENQKLLKKIEELKVVSRAKCLIVQNMNYSESDAHRYIEKQAMDLRISKIDFAMSINRMFDA